MQSSQIIRKSKILVGGGRRKHWKANSTKFVRAALVLSSQIFFSQGYNPAVVTSREHLGSAVLTTQMAEHLRRQCQQGWLLRPLFYCQDMTSHCLQLPFLFNMPMSYFNFIFTFLMGEHLLNNMFPELKMSQLFFF